MDSLARKFNRKQDKKDYKTLYETELNNRKLFEQRYREIHEQYVKLQKESGIAELRKDNLALQKENEFLKENAKNLFENENKKLKEENARLRIELDDLRGFKQQDEQCIIALKKERRKGVEMEDICNG
jgi:hypothetical protein|nr:MAG TPA: centrosomin [Caudoviricetes sp.]